jgi:hypothetical protein
VRSWINNIRRFYVFAIIRPGVKGGRRIDFNKKGEATMLLPPVLMP